MPQKLKKYAKGRPPRLKHTINTSNGITIEYMVTDFLKLIEERPVIYDETSDTQSVLKRESAWREIASKIYPRFDDLPLQDKQFILMKRFKKNWRDHKELLLKSVRMKQANDPKFIPYVFRKELEFFLKHNNINPRDAEYSDDEQVVTTENSSKKQKQKSQPILNNKSRKKRRLSSSHVSDTFSKASTPNSSEHYPRQEKGDTLPSDAINETEINITSPDPMFFCQTATNDSIDLGVSPARHEIGPNHNTRPSQFLRIHNVYSTADNGADEAFFESIKPSLRKIGESQKLDFRIDVLHLLKKYQN